MSRLRKKTRKNLWYTFLILLIFIFFLGVIYKKNYLDKNNNIINNVVNNKQKEEITPKENTTNETDKESSSKSSSKTINNTSTEKKEEPAKTEKQETKNELNNNVTLNIELIGEEELTINVNDKYIDKGVKATDSNGNDVTKYIDIENNVDTSKQGTYYVIYSYGKSIVIRTVNVK